MRSLLRRVRLHSPAAEPWTMQALLVPVGSSDQQVLDWAAGFLSPEAVAELRAVVEREANQTHEP